MDNKGFTLVEILAVIVVIALLGVLITPGILNVINNSKNASNKVLYNNIRTSAIELYEEIDYMDGIFYKYDSSGKTDDTISINNDDNSIIVNVYTLVGNGFLSGEENKDGTKIVLNANNEDISACEIKVTKSVTTNNKVSYEITSGSNNVICPTTDDLKGE